MLTFKENKILSLMMRHLLMLPISHRILSNLSCGMSNIRFALSIKYASSAAYQQVIKLGVLALPHSCPVLPTNVLDSSDSLTLSFQSWEDPGFLGYPGILPSYPSQTQSPILSGGSLGHPGILPWCPLRHRPPPCPEDPLDIPGSSLGVPTDISPHDVLRIPGTSRDPPFMSPETETPCCPEDP